MNEPMPEPAPRAGKKKTPWWIYPMVFFGALPAVFAVFIFVFIVRYSVAHDPDSCPYTLGEPRPLGGPDGVAVREDSRSCMDDVQDHRWVVLRPGEDELPLGNLPLMGADARFEWEAHVDEGRVVVDIVVPDRGELSLREPAAAD